MDRLKKKVEKLERDYKFSARKYGYYNRLISMPSIVITSLSSVFSFMSSSEYVSNDTKDYFIITVAILTTIASMLQTINTSCEFNVKKMKFTEASQDFNHLVDKIFFETEHPNEKDFIDNIEKEIEKVKNQCKFLPLECKVKKAESQPLQSPRTDYSTTI